MLSTVLILLFLVAILYSLASSFYFLVKDAGQGDRTVRRLSWRIGLSMVLLLGLWAGVHTGFIEPQGVNPVQYPPEAPEEGAPPERPDSDGPG